MLPSRPTTPILCQLTPAIKERTVPAAWARSVFTDWMGWRAVCARTVGRVTERTQRLFSSAIRSVRVCEGDYYCLFRRSSRNRWRPCCGWSDTPPPPPLPSDTSQYLFPDNRKGTLEIKETGHKVKSNGIMKLHNWKRTEEFRRVRIEEGRHDLVRAHWFVSCVQWREQEEKDVAFIWSGSLMIDCEWRTDCQQMSCLSDVRRFAMRLNPLHQDALVFLMWPVCVCAEIHACLFSSLLQFFLISDA